MRIAFDATALPSTLGGAGNYILQLVAGLRRLRTGDRLFVLAKDVDVDRLGAWNGWVEAVGVSLPSRPARLAWEQTRLPRLLRRLDVDLLHSPHYTIPIYGVRAKRVVTFHDMIFYLHPEYHQRTKAMFFRRMIAAAAARANHVIADSEATRRDVLHLLGLPGRAVTAVPLAADDRFTACVDPARVEAVCARYGLRRPLLLTVSTLEPRKNLPAVLNVLAQLRRSGIDCSLAIAGTKGWQYRPLFDEVSRLRLAPHVTVLGFVPAEDLPALYRAASVFVYPSLYEGFGLPPLEAMACAVPVVASNRSAIPEVVGDAGVLVDPTDVDEMAAAVRRLLQDASAREELSRRALQRAAAFSWDRAATLTYEVYNAVAAVRARKTPRARAATPAVSALVVSYRSYPELRACLGSLASDEICPEIIVVDNAPVREALESLAQAYPRATFIPRADNPGFAAAVNEAAGSALGEYLLLLNPDATVRPGAIAAMADFLGRSPDVAIVGPRVYESNGDLQRSARGFPNLLTAFFGRTGLLTRLWPSNPISRRNLPADGSTAGALDVDWVAGSCFLVRADVFRSVGGFDRRFFLYWEDADLCRRIRAAGFRVVHLPEAVVVHTGGGSSRHATTTALVAFHKSAFLFYRKHRHGPGRHLALAVAAAGLTLRLLLKLIAARVRDGGRWMRRDHGTVAAAALTNSQVIASPSSRRSVEP